MFCKNCGNIMDDNDKFCKSCGAPVPQGQSQLPQQNYGYRQPQQNYGYRQNDYQQPQYNYQQPQHNYQQAQGYNYQQAHYANQTPGYGYAQPSSSVSFGDAIRLYFANYANFNGRARRSEYWYAYLFVWLVNFVVGMVLPPLSLIVALALLVPNISMAVRRLHDTGKSGWNCLWLLLPLAGLIVLIIFLCADSEGANQYGPSTKY